MSNKFDTSKFDAFVFGQRLRRERKRLEYTQKTLADIGKVSRATQISYENGQHTPNCEYLFLVSQAGIEVSYLFYEWHTGIIRSLDKDVLLRIFNIVDDVGRDRFGNVYDTKVRYTFFLRILESLRTQDIKKIDWEEERARLIKLVRNKSFIPDAEDRPGLFDGVNFLFW